MTVLNSDPIGHHVSLVSIMQRLTFTLVTGARQWCIAQDALVSRMGLQQLMPYATGLTLVSAKAGVTGVTRNSLQIAFGGDTRSS